MEQSSSSSKVTAEARREVREWIKEHTPPTQSSTKRTTQENHDAYDWLIIHVVVPNTAAATQPRTSGKSSENSSGTAAEKAAARWRGGGSTTILEKLRADFNGSSKSTIDRIVQIRIGINDVPYEILPRVVPAIPGSYTETPQENENAWADFISKLKERILASFDLRVGQYEEDIQERDNQRSLPGWNFCTFFVLKEGLAGGFESVGLVEDALVGYDELAVGLDAIVREQAITGTGPQHGGDFLPFTEDLKKVAENTKVAMLRDLGQDDTEESIDLQSNPISADSDVDEIPVDASKKRYRQLILSNNISIFDFRCYIFARQLSLLLRLANATSSQDELLAKLKEQRELNMQGIASRSPAVKQKPESENLVILAEICRRTLAFVASISRILRDDIWASQLQLHKSTQEGDDKDALKVQPIQDPIMEKVVDNIASSFTFGVAQQILAQTSTKALPIPPSTLAPPNGKMELGGQEPKASIPEPKTMMHPARTTSLAVRSISRDPSTAGNRSSSVPGVGNPSMFIKAGLEELAGHRAELYLLSRSVLEQVGKERGWSTGWDEMAKIHGSGREMEDVSLDDEVSVSKNVRERDEEAARKDDFVRVVLELLSKSAAAEKETQSRRSALKFGRTPNFEPDQGVSAASYLGLLLQTTKSFQHEIRVPLENFFAHLDVDSTARYHSEQDSFTLTVKLRYLLEDDLTVEKAKVRIDATFGETHREIWLETDGPNTFTKGDGFFTVNTNVIVPGTYTVGHLFASKYMHLDRNRFLELELSSGWNEVIEGELHIRAATAGMRLQTSEAIVIVGSLVLAKKQEAGVIKFGALSSHSLAKIRMPFNLEHESSDVSLKIEVSYTTEKVHNIFSDVKPLTSVELPIRWLRNV
ncbi:putative Trafficking protein particle complex subunit 10 [Glarea lozoyensis 74030]|uniref:Putative Trafficking protein particle complex subunit 10 n=1 Tax=Glarea lozoyensis (strain ATCC 74030 / MF5533) TaxID=1104152 RepID=H0EM28_GLAL7|nr:putative Trafficking protein particle complex subunit 10 [Glarea lozoyensis 74030]